MLAKCANPGCSKRFLYLREGKLFRIEVAPGGLRDTTAGPALVPRKGVRRIEHYWLCHDCAASMTLTCDPQQGVVAVPLQPVVRRAIAS